MKKLFILSILLMSICSYAQTGVYNPVFHKSDSMINLFIHTYGIGGGQVAISKDGRLIYNRGFGFADQAQTEIAQPYHKYRLASVSKPITSIAIMKLIQDGLLSLTDTVFGAGRILDQAYYLSVITDSRIYNITVQNLLEHNSGWDRTLPCDGYAGCDPPFFPLHVTATFGEPNPVGDSTLIKFLLLKGLNHDPGTTYAYSNVGYLVLGKVIEKITGMKYDDYVKTHIFEPISACDIQLGKNLVANKLEREAEYNSIYTTLSCYGTGATVPWQYGGWSVEAMDAHGGWVASSEDMVKLMLSVDGFTTVPDILNTAAINMMVTPSVTNSGYAKGWAVNGANNWWHQGSLDGTATEIVRTSGGYTWSLLFNHRSDSTTFYGDLDNLGWNCIGSVSAFPAYNLFPPAVNTSNINVTKTSAGSVRLNWTNGSGDGRLIIATETSSIKKFPVDGTTYVADSFYTVGQNLGDTTFVVYAGNHNSVNVLNLNPAKTYRFAAFEYYNNAITGNNIVYKEGCRADIAVDMATIALGTSIEFSGTEPQIYPNPVIDAMMLEADNITYHSFTITNIMGQKMMSGEISQPQITVNVKQLPSGVYFITFAGSNASRVKKFVKL